MQSPSNLPVSDRREMREREERGGEEGGGGGGV